MTHFDPPQWQQLEQRHPAPNLPDDDFSNYLDLDNLDINFPLFDAGANDLTNNTQTTSAQDVDMQLDPFSLDQYTTRVAHIPLDSSAQIHHYQNDMKQPAVNFNSQPQYHASQEQASPMQPAGFEMPNAIPPTPNSTELFPDGARFMMQLDSQARHMMQRHQQLRKDDAAVRFLCCDFQTLPADDEEQMTYTPMVSPDVAGTDAYYALNPDYPMPGTYLSPLTSPAMNPQPSLGQRHSRGHSRTAESSLAASPINLDHGFDLPVDMSGSNEPPRKTRRKAQPARPSAAVGRSRPSPITAAQRRRDSLNLKVVTKDVAAAKSQEQGPPATQTPEGASRDGSTSHSVSPPSLSDTLMAPPPKPMVGTPLLPRPGSTNILPASSTLPPATPASLMRLQQKRKTGARDGTESPLSTPQSATGELTHNFEDLVLPEAAAGTPALDGQGTPRIVARGAERVRTANPLSATSSPLMHAMNSPVLAPKNGGRISKKRNSGSSVLASPALRPKISPSIKPLLPEGCELFGALCRCCELTNALSAKLSEEARTMLLATKSNYQNLVEGNHLAGVNYPSELSTNLTSKRTSHKIAEQGRRNRINTALHEMQTLLPPSPAGPANGKDKETSSGEGDSANDDKTGGTAQSKRDQQQQQGSNSKAATVEHAIDYIKELKARLEEERSETERLRLEMKALEARLGAVPEQGAA